MKMRKRAAKTLIIIILNICFLLSGALAGNVLGENGAKNVFAQPDESDIIPDTPIAPEIAAPSAILTETMRGQVLYQKQANKKLHISAANKIMAAIVTIENTSNLDSKVTISRESAEAEGFALSLEVGEKYTVEDLLYAMMLINANDATIALAEFVAGGDINKFITLMNNKAHELNLKNTHFTNPTGLYDENQYTTAYDLAILIRYAINSLPGFNKIFSSQAKPWFREDGKIDVLTSQNQLFWSYEGVDGGKTGYNNKDQQTAITTATRGNQRLICIVLDSPESEVFKDSTKLLDYGFNNFRKSILVPKGYPYESVQIGEKTVNLISLSDVYYTHPIGEDYIKSLAINTVEGLTPPITRDTVIGTAKYVLNDNTVIDVNLYPDVEIPLPESFYTSALKKIQENKDIFILLAFLVFIEVILILYNIGKLIGRVFRKLSGRNSRPLNK